MEKKVSLIFRIVIILAAVLMVGMVFKIKQEQKNSVNAAKERYEQMISGEQVMTLTEDVLEEDFQEYVKGVQRAKQLLNLYLGMIGAFIGLLLLWMLVQVVFDMFSRKGIGVFIGHSVAILIFAALLIGGYFIVKDKILPQVNKEDPSSDPHYFAELHLTGVQRDVKTEDANPQDDASSKTTVYYYLITDTGARISVKEEVYDRFGEPGIYYAGRTEHTIFSLYEGKYFKLFGK